MLADDELLKNKQDFSDILYKYIDRRIPKTCLRIFEYRNRICLAYYILTDLTEPGSNRTGMYLILGMTCPQSIFKEKSISFAEGFLAFYAAVKDFFKLSGEDWATKALRILWEAYKTENYESLIFGRLQMASTASAVRPILSSKNKYKVKKQHLIRLRKYNIVYIMAEENIVLRVILFVYAAAKQQSLFNFGIDYSDIKGYGQKCIKILFQGNKFPSSAKKQN